MFNGAVPFFILNLTFHFKIILCTVKDFFRQILKIGNEPTKDVVTNEIKNYYDNKKYQYIYYRNSII